MIVRMHVWRWVIALSLVAIAVGSWASRDRAPSRAASIVRASFDGVASSPDERRFQGRTPSQVLPAGFAQNRGQFEERVRFALRGEGMNVFFTEDSVVYVLQEGMADGRESRAPTLADVPRVRGQVVRMHLLGASEEVEVIGDEPTDARTSYFRGSAESWIEGAQSFARIEYREIHPKIDLVYSLQSGTLKSEWIVRPGGDVSNIRWRYEGASKVEIAQGALHIETGSGVLEEEPPWVYQRVDSTGPLMGSTSSPVEGRYLIAPDGTVGFEIGDYDVTKVLHIDPSLEWSTFFGGMWSESIIDLHVDAAGDVYVSGWTFSPDFPLTSGAFDTSHNGGFGGDGFVSKLDGASGALVWSTFLGGRGSEVAAGVGAGADGSVYVTGWTDSSDFPVTQGAFDTTYAGSVDTFVTKLAANGSRLEYSSFIGGVSTDVGRALALDAQGCVYVAGASSSPDYPTTAGAYDPTHDRSTDVVVTKLDPAGTSLVYSTFIGGFESENALSIAIDADGNAHVTGLTESSDYPITPGAFDSTMTFREAFVSKLDPTGSTLLWSTFLGGSSQSDEGNAVAVSVNGDVFVGGRTASTDFPTTPGAYDRTVILGDGFLTKFDAAGAVIFSTVLGGSSSDTIYALAIDDHGRAVCAGGTQSKDFPVTAGAFDSELGQTDLADAFVARFNDDGSGLIYSTYLGGTDSEYIQAAGVLGPDVFVAGTTYSADFPLVGAFDQVFTPTEGFITRLRLGPILAFEGTPSSGSPARFVLSSAPSLETGAFAQVALSCSGTAGIPLPGGQTLPLTFDACTSLSLASASMLRGTIDAAGQAVTPTIAFPPAPPGLKVYCAAFTYFPGGSLHSVTPPIEILTQ